MSTVKQTLKSVALLLALFLFGGIIDVIPKLGDIYLQALPSVYFLSLGIALTIYFSMRIVSDKLRKNLIFIGILIVFWFFVRLEKYTVFVENEFITRMLWYAYYIPMILIPQVSFCASLDVGVPRKRNRIFKIPTLIISLALIIVVFTNDLHQLVFGFMPGFINSNTIYSHEPLYWVIIAYIATLFLSTLIILTIKCKLNSSRRMTVILLLYCVAFTIWMVAILLGLNVTFTGMHFGEFPETACFLYGGAWFISINIGLIPSDKGYDRLFKETSLAVQMCDSDYKIAYKSPHFREMSLEDMKMDASFLMDEDTYVYSEKTIGGFAHWQVDVSKLRKVNDELSDVNDALYEESLTIAEENEMRKKKSEIESKSRLYDAIAKRTSTQSQKIKEISEEVNEELAKGGELACDNSIKQDDASNSYYSVKMRLASFYAVYIKRMANLMLLGSKTPKISVKELELAIAESLRYFEKCGKKTEIIGEFDKGDIEAEIITNAYEHFENALEESLDASVAVLTVMEGETLKLAIETEEETRYVKIDIKRGRVL